jgi:sugar-specific transcriptional regulator TrmB
VASFEEHVSTLVELGLSPSQAKVCLVLAKSKNLTAHTINKFSGIPRSDVYRVLAELENAGLVEKIISKPEKFHAVSIEECVSTLLQKRFQKTQQLQKDGLKLTQYFVREKTALEEQDEKLGFVIITGKSAVYGKTEKLFKSTQHSICFLGLRRRTLVWLSSCLPSLEGVIKRNVECRLIMQKPERNLYKPLRNLLKYPNFSLRIVLEQPKTAFSVWDQKEILMSTSAIDSSAPLPILWSNNKSMVDLCQGYFECMWMKAENADFNV